MKIFKEYILKFNADVEIFVSENEKLSNKHIKLLKAVAETRSITRAASKVGISYKNAWDSLNYIDTISPQKMVIREEHSKKSGSKLSDYATKLIETYDRIKFIEQKILDNLENIDLENFTDLPNLRRMSMKLSARNQLLVKIKDVKKGAVNTQIVAELDSGDTMRSIITQQSASELNIKAGDEAKFIFKASSVIVGKDDGKDLKISAANQIKGVIKNIDIGSVNAEIIIDIKGNQNIVAIITKESVSNMKLQKGDKVVAVIKASSIMVGI